MRRAVVMLVLLLVPGVAGAQSAPTNTAPVFPSFPWALGMAIPTGQLLRDLWIPPQTVVVDTLIAVPTPPSEGDAAASTNGTAQAAESAPPQYATLRQSVVVPGYWVRQTTAGDYYPSRWMLEQVAPGAYRWRLLPAEVRNAR